MGKRHTIIRKEIQSVLSLTNVFLRVYSVLSISDNENIGDPKNP